MTLIEFLQDELETRKQSHLPNPDEDEQGYIAEAQAALAEARALIAERDNLKAELQAKKKEHTARYIATLKAHAEAMAENGDDIVRRAELSVAACGSIGDCEECAWLQTAIDDYRKRAAAYRRDFPEER